jgi:hypothetical protein
MSAILLGALIGGLVGGALAPVINWLRSRRSDGADSFAWTTRQQEFHDAGLCGRLLYGGYCGLAADHAAPCATSVHHLPTGYQNRRTGVRHIWCGCGWDEWPASGDDFERELQRHMAFDGATV